MARTWIIITLFFSLIACQSSQKDHSTSSSSPSPSPTSINNSSSTTDSLLVKGKKITQTFQQHLSALLIRQVRQGGPASAIKYCNLHAIPLTDSLSQDLGVNITRLTHKPRNHQNKAEGREREIIQRYLRKIDSNQTPQPLIDTTSSGGHTYFAPIIIKKALCLNCHGKPQANITPSTLKAIRQAYPHDQATGFELNDLRGIWRVDFKTN